MDKIVFDRISKMLIWQRGQGVYRPPKVPYVPDYPRFWKGVPDIPGIPQFSCLDPQKMRKIVLNTGISKFLAARYNQE